MVVPPADSRKPVIGASAHPGFVKSTISRELNNSESSPGCSLRRRHNAPTGGRNVGLKLRLAVSAGDARPSVPVDCAVPEQREPSPLTPCLSSSPARSLACNRLISDIAWRVIVDALDQIVFEGEPVTHDFKALYTELKYIRDGNDTRSRKLQKLSAELGCFAFKLAHYPGELSPYWKQLGAVLQVLSPWLKSVGEQWLTLELLVEQGHAQQPLLDKAANLTGLTRRLLADPQLQVLVGKGRVVQLDRHLSSIDQTLTQVRLWQALPGGASVADYLQLLAGNPSLGGALADSLTRLGRALGRVQKGYPDAGTLTEKLSWLLCTLNDPALREPLQPPLERLLGSAQQVEQLFSLCRVAESLRHFSLRGTLAEQTLWLLRLLKDNAGDGKMGAGFSLFHTLLGADPATLSLLNRLLGMKSGPDGVRLLLKDLSALLAFPVARQLAGYAVPGVVELEKLYRQSTADES